MKTEHEKLIVKCECSGCIEVDRENQIFCVATVHSHIAPGLRDKLVTAYNSTCAAGVNPESIPDLLEALESAVRIMEPYKLSDTWHGNLWRKMDTALDKARGKEGV